jgi:adenylate cyclase
MAAKMIDLNKEWRAEAEAAGRPYTVVAIGIGINSGECCVGNLGSYRRFDYSAIGDNVNLTSRLEGLTKYYGLPLIVGEDTARRLAELPFLEVDTVRVKGRVAPTRLFTLLSVLGADERDWPSLKAEHDRFMAAYRAGSWQDATALLEQLRARNIRELSGLYQTYANRIEKLAQAPPETWDGVYEAEEK